jgi:hypothetical protein
MCVLRTRVTKSWLSSHLLKTRVASRIIVTSCEALEHAKIDFDVSGNGDRQPPNSEIMSIFCQTRWASSD